jgi:hypothetical protein
VLLVELCLECYNKAILRRARLLCSPEDHSQRDYNAEMQPEDQELGAGNKQMISKRRRGIPQLYSGFLRSRRSKNTRDSKLNNGKN